MVGAWMLGFLATIGLFLPPPFFQLISTVGDEISNVDSIDLSKPPPPPLPTEQQPPPQKEETKKEPRLKQDYVKLTLAPLELALNPGMGDGTVGSDFSINFQVNAMAELGIVFELCEVDRIPQPIHRVAPIYPYEMKQAGVSGFVSLLFICDSKGRVKRVQVKSSSHMEFEKDVISAIRQWIFDPGMKDGQPVKVRMLIPFKFNLSDR
jgi:protein TonB